MRKTAPLLLGTLLLVGAGCFGTASNETDVTVPPPEQAEETTMPVEPDGGSGMGGDDPAEEPGMKEGDTSGSAELDVVLGETKTVTVIAQNFGYDVKSITVNKGDTVRVTFRNAEGFHDWKLDEFGAATSQLAAGAEETIEFVADKAGTFEYYCSVGKHRQMGMVGTLIVKE